MAKANRQRFTQKDKRKIVRKADGCQTLGAVGALLRREGLSAMLADPIINEMRSWQGVGREPLTIHADRGTAMTSKSVALLRADLGVTKTTAARPSPTTTRSPSRRSRR